MAAASRGIPLDVSTGLSPCSVTWYLSICSFDRSPPIYEKQTGSWKVVELLFNEINTVIEMEGRETRSKTVSTASLEPFYTRR